MNSERSKSNAYAYASDVLAIYGYYCSYYY